jgi:SAM-dependent methyltransferase
MPVDPRLQAHLDANAGSDAEFVDASFALVLRRPPEPDARERALLKLAEGTLSRATLLHELATAPEVERVRQLDDAIAFARGARARGERPRHLQAPPGTDERLVEVPWVLSRLRRGRVLEVGHAFAEPAYIAALVEAGPGELVGVDLAEAEVPGFETVVADARALPFPDTSFDQVLLVSTLEHIGADNEVYGLEGAPDDTGRAAALQELRRVLRPSGSLLVTVPLGEPGDYGWFRQEDVRGWTRLFTGAGYFVEEQEAYELLEEGWRAAPAFDPEGVVYGARGPAASAVLCAELSPRRLRRLATPDGMRRTARRRLGPTYRRLRGSTGDSPSTSAQQGD